MKLLWGMAEQTFCLCNNMYGVYMGLCLALTNYHVSLMPLRSEDGDIEKNYVRRLQDQYRVKERKRKASQLKHKKMAKARREVAAAAAKTNGDISDIDDVYFKPENEEEEDDNAATDDNDEGEGEE